MNVKRLLAIKEAILKYPEHFDMNQVLCGTVGCIVGFACAHRFAQEYPLQSEFQERRREEYSTEEFLPTRADIAEAWLEIDTILGGKLFYPKIKLGFPASYKDWKTQDAANWIDLFIARYATPEEKAQL